jgi:CheY-like chemotaxis protein
VEDAEPLRKLALTVLEERGYKVLAAASGEEAIQLAAAYQGKIDLLLTDVIMPGMNGRVLAEHLTSKDRGIKTLYMSGYSDNFIAGHGVLEAGTHLLHKPFTEEVILSKVREVLKPEQDIHVDPPQLVTPGRKV